jgi:hypothetical protein
MGSGSNGGGRRNRINLSAKNESVNIAFL